MGLVTNMYVPSPVHPGDALDSVYGYYDGQGPVQNVVWTLFYGSDFSNSYVMRYGEAYPNELVIPSPGQVGSEELYGTCRLHLNWEQDDSGGYGGWTPWQFGTNDFLIEASGFTPTEISGSLIATSSLEGTLAGLVLLSGALSANSALAGSLAGSILLAGSLSAGSTLLGSLSNTTYIAGAISAGSTLAGTLGNTTYLAGVLTSTSALAGQLTAANEPVIAGFRFAAGELFVPGLAAGEIIF